jgi:hypothetical protein
VSVFEPAEGMLPFESRLASRLPAHALDALRRSALAIAHRLVTVVFLIEATALPRA